MFDRRAQYMLYVGVKSHQQAFIECSKLLHISLILFQQLFQGMQLFSRCQVYIILPVSVHSIMVGLLYPNNLQ